MLRRALAILAILAAATLALTGSAHAADDPTCTFSPPTRVAIFRSFTSLPPSFSGTCRESANGYAAWVLDGNSGAGDAHFDPDSGDQIAISDLTRFGTLVWKANGAGTQFLEDWCEPSTSVRREAECNVVLDDYQNEPVTTVKLAAAPWLTGARSGSRVTLSVTSHTWSSTIDDFVAHALGGELQVQNANGTWSRLGNPFVTAGNGKRSFSFTLAGPRSFRYAQYSTAYAWDKVSATVTR